MNYGQTIRPAVMLSRAPLACRRRWTRRPLAGLARVQAAALGPGTHAGLNSNQLTIESDRQVPFWADSADSIPLSTTSKPLCQQGWGGLAARRLQSYRLQDKSAKHLQSTSKAPSLGGRACWSMVSASAATVRTPLLLFLMAALCSTLRGALASAAAHRGRTPAAFLLRPAPAPAWTTTATRRGSTATASRASGASSSSSRGASNSSAAVSSGGGGGAGARDFYIEIPDATLPGSPVRRVHVLDTGPPQQQQAQQQSPPLVLIGGTAQVINSWVGHTSALARERRLIIYEARGQGKTELDLEGATMPTHVGDFERCVSETFRRRRVV